MLETSVAVLDHTLNSEYSTVWYSKIILIPEVWD